MAALCQTPTRLVRPPTVAMRAGSEPTAPSPAGRGDQLRSARSPQWHLRRSVRRRGPLVRGQDRRHHHMLGDNDVPMQRVRPALDELKRRLGVDHALASRRLYTDGAELLFDYALRSADAKTAPLVLELVVARHGQRVFAEAVEQYLVNIEYGPDQYASLIHLPSYSCAEVVTDPLRSFGHPILARGGARVSDVLDRFWAGESLTELTDEFGAPPEQLEDLVRVASRRAA